MGYDSRAAYYRKNFLDRERVVSRADLDIGIEQAAGRLNAVLDALRTGPLAERIVVFGSVARGRFLPGDVDAVVDLRVGPGVGDADLKGLLDLAYANYGLFDPFVVLPSGRLRVRGPRAVSWTDAENADAILASIREEGRPLADVSISPDPSSAPYEPDAWLAPEIRRVESFRTQWEGMTRGGWCRRADIPAYQRRILEAVAGDDLPEVRALFEEFSAQAPERLWRDLEIAPAPGPRA